MPVTNTFKLLAELQQALHTRYDLDLPYQVEDFVCHDARSLIEQTGCTLHGPETLLVQQQGDNLDITLFLDLATVSDVSQKPWERHWNGRHFNDYCTILEGVSHFVYLVFCAHHNRSVRPLELELQAEVDKFVFSTLHVDTSRYTNEEHLLKRLFVDIDYRQELTGELQDRYETANFNARNYCTWLAENFHLAPDNHQLGAELARFYRTTGQAKFKHITERSVASKVHC